MLIVCPSCATSYEVDAPLLGESGRSVRCVRCRTVWLATPSIETVTGGGDAWPSPAPDPWAMAGLPEETSASEQFRSLGEDARHGLCAGSANPLNAHCCGVALRARLLQGCVVGLRRGRGSI